MKSHNLHVLVMEKNQEALKNITDVLGSFGLCADGFTDAADAAKALQSSHFDGVFLEASPVNIGASSLARTVRESTLNQSTPVVFVANGPGTTTMSEAFAAGGTFFLEKPADRRHFRTMLEVTRFA